MNCVARFFALRRIRWWRSDPWQCRACAETIAQCERCFQREQRTAQAKTEEEK